MGADLRFGTCLATVVLAALAAACGPAAPAAGVGGGATAAVITAVASTSVPLTAVSGASQPPPAPSLEPPTPIPTIPGSASPTELKYKLLDQFPDFFYCDPDAYPVARADETQLALTHFPEIQANAEEFQAILAHNGLDGLTSFTDAQKLQVYADYKKLAAIVFEAAQGAYQFQLRTADGKQGYEIQGLIDAAGRIHVQSKTPTLATCPICLAAWTLIETPGGAVPVVDLRVGDIVWTQDAAGRRVAEPVLQVASAPVPVTHEVIHLVLNDGRQLWASAGHPAADGRRLGELTIGEELDGERIVGLDRVGYGLSATYDLLPAGGTGYYWADGILLGSTLAGP